MNVTEDLLPRYAADDTTHILSQATALPLVHNVARAAIPTIGNTSATQGHPLDLHPEEQKMVTPGTDVDQDPNAEEEGTNFKARKVRIMTIIVIIIIIIIIIIIKIIIIIIISPDHNNHSKIYAMNNMLTKLHI